MGGCDYRHCLGGVALLAATLWWIPSYGVLLAISTVVVLAFALGIALLVGCFAAVERGADEVERMRRNVKPIEIRTRTVDQR